MSTPVWIKADSLTDQFSAASSTSGTWRPGNRLSAYWDIQQYTEWTTPVIVTSEGILSDDGFLLIGDDGEQIISD